MTCKTTKISDFTQRPFSWVAGSALNSHMNCRKGRLPHADRPKTSHLLSDFLPSDNTSSVWPLVLLTMSVHSSASNVCVPPTYSSKQTEREGLTLEFCFFCSLFWRLFRCGICCSEATDAHCPVRNGSQPTLFGGTTKTMETMNCQFIQNLFQDPASEKNFASSCFIGER